MRIFVLLCLVLPCGRLAAQTASDSAAIVATAKDYIEGWYTGDVARMQRALHPELVKRILARDTVSKRTWIENQSASRLVAGVARGGGTRTPAEKRRTDVVVLDVFRHAASVKVEAGEWVDYLHLIKEGDRWLILNVLWELRS
jgi:phage pi2 protein 07